MSFKLYAYRELLLEVKLVPREQTHRGFTDHDAVGDGPYCSRCGQPSVRKWSTYRAENTTEGVSPLQALEAYVLPFFKDLTEVDPEVIQVAYHWRNDQTVYALGYPVAVTVVGFSDPEAGGAVPAETLAEVARMASALDSTGLPLGPVMFAMIQE